MKYRTSDENCTHFNGFQHDECKAGLSYLALCGGVRDGIGIRLPCCASLHERADAKEKVDCPKFHPKSPEEIEAREKQVQKAIDRMQKVSPWARAMKKKHGRGISARDTCPICEGVIAFSIANYNGHMRACCETQDCVNFIE